MVITADSVSGDEEMGLRRTVPRAAVDSILLGHHEMGAAEGLGILALGTAFFIACGWGLVCQ